MPRKYKADFSSLRRLELPQEAEDELLRLTAPPDTKLHFYVKRDFQHARSRKRYPLPSRVPVGAFPTQLATLLSSQRDESWPTDSLEYWICVRATAARQLTSPEGARQSRETVPVWRRVAERLGDFPPRDLIAGVDQWFPSDPFVKQYPQVEEILPAPVCETCSLAQKGPILLAMRGTTVCPGHLKWANTMDRRTIKGAWERTATALRAAGLSPWAVEAP